MSSYCGCRIRHLLSAWVFYGSGLHSVQLTGTKPPLHLTSSILHWMHLSNRKLACRLYLLTFLSALDFRVQTNHHIPKLYACIISSQALRGLRQEHERIKRQYEERIRGLREQLQERAAKKADKERAASAGRVKELEKQVEELRAFYAKKVKVRHRQAG